MNATMTLRGERANIFHEHRHLIDRAHDEGREMTAEEDAQFSRAMADIEEMGNEVRAREAEDDARRDESRAYIGETPIAELRRYNRSFRHYVRRGEVPTDLAVLMDRPELRDTLLSSDAKGGYLVMPIDVSAFILKPDGNRVWIYDLCKRAGTVIQVTQSKSVGVRKRVARDADADWTTEVQGVTEDVTGSFGRRDLTPWPLTKLAKLSMRLVALVAAPEREPAQELGWKFEVTKEKGFLTGSGSAQPLGIFTADATGISTGRDVAASGTTFFTGDNLVDMKFNLKEAYLNSPFLRWFFGRGFLARAQKLKAASTVGGNDLEPIWAPGLTHGSPDKLLNISYMLSEFAPNIFTTGLYVAALGDLGFYAVAEMMGVFIQRVDEFYSLTNEIGFFGRQWCDGAPIIEEAFTRLRLA